MKELKEFTVERLEELSRFKTNYEIASLAKIALAAKQAKSVAWLLSGGGAKNIVSFDSGNAYSDPLREVTPLYTTPPLNHTEQDGWIKCSERMPECSKWDHAAVIASEGSNSFVAYYNKHECKFLDEPFGESLGNKITHWMPLPKPPVAAPKPEV